MSELTLRFIPDHGDDTNRLGIEVQTDAFSGRGWSWTDRASLVDFASSLKAYPLPTDKPAIFTMGYNLLKGDDLIGYLEVRPADRLGNLLVRVAVADPHERWRRVRAEFLTHYPEVERFTAQLTRMLAGGSETAVLLGD